KFNITNNNKILTLLHSENGEDNNIKNVIISNNEFNINTSLYAVCLIQTNKFNNINSLNVNDNVININNGTYNANYTLNVYNYDLFNFINNKFNCNYALPLFRIGLGNGIINIRNKYLIKNIYSNNSQRNRLTLMIPLFNEKQLDTSKILFKIIKNGMSNDYDNKTYIKLNNDSTYNILTSLDVTGNEVTTNLTSTASALRIYDLTHGTMFRTAYASDINSYLVYLGNDYINNTDDIIDIEVEITQVK
ncbi:MAG: hypothetical protein IIZ67_01005, partial [Bacilli bacterium]|nr:hypothetical protein [Bacilli bacterium]